MNGSRGYAPIGTVYAYAYFGKSFTFTAPWNEEMIVEPGDFIATTELGSNDVYRIQREVFEQTYRISALAA